MADEQPRELIVIDSGDGIPLNVGTTTGLVGRAEWTDGAYSMMDQIVGPGKLVPVHSHELETQVVFVLRGTLTCWVDGRAGEVRKGAYALRPAGLPHSMWNATETDVRMLEITSPATRFEEYHQRLSDLLSSRTASPDDVVALAGGYGITFYPRLTEELREATGLE